MNCESVSYKVGIPVTTACMFRVVHILFLCSLAFAGYAQKSIGDPLVDAGNNLTPTWQQTIATFEALAIEMPQATLIEIGKSDVGRSIHAFILSEDARNLNHLDSLKRLRSKQNTKASLLINNAIHPGEPCGVDASIEWVRSLMENKRLRNEMLAKVDVVIIPMYNVGGALNRNCCTRTNQDGPENYGFRGNARNLDLNRDFIKMDSRNAQAFVRLYHAIDPDVFIDTHTSNGADYPFAMTLITTQSDKAGPIIGPYLKEVMQPYLFSAMAALEVPIVPYVNTRNETPESGIIEFLETPRYSTGYTTLFGTLGFTTEAHMLKSFPIRVDATVKMIDCIAGFTRDNAQEIKTLRVKEKKRVTNASNFPVHWELDEHDSIMIPFQGYSARREISNVTGDIRLKYDHNETWSHEIPFFGHFSANEIAEVPSFYVLPQAWREVAERCAWNGVQMEALERDTIVDLKVIYIKGMVARSSAYEGHHINRLDSIETRIEPVRLFKGDWVIPAGQEKARYLAETFDPRGHDSFFVWNFFDSAMQQKEYYSSYVFEETALEMLETDLELKEQFTMAKSANPSLASSSRAQLNWLYEHSKHFEGTVNRYPIFQSLPAVD